MMARYCELHRPKLYVSVSVFHNPTGYCLSPGSAHRVLQLANQDDFHIVEDDTYSHIAPEHAARLCALDGLQRTIHVCGFAKILAPNWRVGFLAANPSLIEPLLDTKLLGTLHAGCTFAVEPAGLLGWVDTGVDTEALEQRMLDKGYLLAPDTLFNAERKPGTLMCINSPQRRMRCSGKSIPNWSARCERRPGVRAFRQGPEGPEY